MILEAGGLVEAVAQRAKGDEHSRIHEFMYRIEYSESGLTIRILFFKGPMVQMVLLGLVAQ